jgi:hypothetical protein
MMGSDNHLGIFRNLTSRRDIMSSPHLHRIVRPTAPKALLFRLTSLVSRHGKGTAYLPQWEPMSRVHSLCTNNRVQNRVQPLRTGNNVHLGYGLLLGVTAVATNRPACLALSRTRLVPYVAEVVLEPSALALECIQHGYKVQFLPLMRRILTFYSAIGQRSNLRFGMAPLRRDSGAKEL